jgi:hypothetical protein
VRLRLVSEAADGGGSRLVGSALPRRRLRAVDPVTEQKLTNLPVTTSDGRLAGLLLREDADRALAAVKKA